MNFWLGGTDPQRRGRSPQLVGALGKDAKMAWSGERTAAIFVAVAVKMDIEGIPLAPPSGQT